MQKITPQSSIAQLILSTVVKYRSRSEIVSQILDAALGSGETKTRIMYKAYLSHAQLKDYLAVMVDNGLLEHDSTVQRYRTTEKGLRYNKYCSEINGFISLEQEIHESMM